MIKIFKQRQTQNPEQFVDGEDNAALPPVYDAFGEQINLTAKPAPSGRLESVLLGIFGLVTLALLIVAGASGIRTIQKSLREVSATAVVVEVVSRLEFVNRQDTAYKEYYFPVVQFKSRDGALHRVMLEQGSRWRQFETGAQVAVMYDRFYPTEVRLQSISGFVSLWLLPLVSAALGIAFTTVLFPLWKFSFRAKG